MEGEPSHVDFPDSLIWELHKLRKGSVYKIAHSHPDGLGTLSPRDFQMLKAWAFALHPWPARLSVIYRDNSESELIQEKVYMCQIMNKLDWEVKGKGFRPTHIFEEYHTIIGYDEKVLIPWEEWIISHSYERGGK